MPVIPFDCTRCEGVRDEDGLLVHPCNKCRRVLWAEPASNNSPWFTFPPREKKGAKCTALWRIPSEKEKTDDSEAF